MILVTQHEPDYELIDSGNGQKLERYGDYVLARPDPQALWRPRFPVQVWHQADAEFIREGKKTTWKTKKNLPTTWNISFGGLVFEIAPTTFKHTGLFPEHVSTWKWLQEKITHQTHLTRPVNVLNLFGYTGGASLACAQAGATVCHVDGSKLAIEWAKRNQKLSGLSADSIRWILDDVLVFLKREIKRGNTYDIIVMDPPAFGRGPDGEVWDIQEHLPQLLELCMQVLSPQPIALVMNGYASGFSSLAYHHNLIPFQKKFGGSLTHGELAIAESLSEEERIAHSEARLLPCGIFARWELS
jgi:23S rRNA (cytosine1962-C5)-methyltransferase